jgi:hypothetical protein
MILSEGAGAIVLCRQGDGVKLERIASGTTFQKQVEATESMEKIFVELCEAQTDLVIVSANGTFVDAAEGAGAARNAPGAMLYPIKAALGESVGASSIWQTICGAQSLLTQRLPPGTWQVTRGRLEHSNEAGNGPEFSRVVISVCGLNQQVAGVRLIRDYG